MTEVVIGTKPSVRIHMKSILSQLSRANPNHPSGNVKSKGKSGNVKLYFTKKSKLVLMGVSVGAPSYGNPGPATAFWTPVLSRSLGFLYHMAGCSWLQTPVSKIIPKLFEFVISLKFCILHNIDSKWKEWCLTDRSLFSELWSIIIHS